MDFWKQMEASMGDLEKQKQQDVERYENTIKLLSEGEILDELPDPEKEAWIVRHGRNFNSLYQYDNDLHNRLGDHTLHGQALQEIQEKLAILAQDQDLADRLADVATKDQAYKELQEKFSQK